MKKWIVKIELRWEDAFLKFGYDDGDGYIGTNHVVDALLGYDVECDTFGMHNSVIIQITDVDGNEMIPEGTDIGYDDPREYLPKHIVEYLDNHFYTTEE
jgi:hypothetical protein